MTHYMLPETNSQVLTGGLPYVIDFGTRAPFNGTRGMIGNARYAWATCRRYYHVLGVGHIYTVPVDYNGLSSLSYVESAL